MLTAVDSTDKADCWGKLLVDAFKASEGKQLVAVHSHRRPD
jgi:hypothetical protein